MDSEGVLARRSALKTQLLCSGLRALAMSPFSSMLRSECSLKLLDAGSSAPGLIDVDGVVRGLLEQQLRFNSVFQLHRPFYLAAFLLSVLFRACTTQLHENSVLQTSCGTFSFLVHGKDVRVCFPHGQNPCMKGAETTTLQKLSAQLLAQGIILTRWFELSVPWTQFQNIPHRKAQTAFASFGLLRFV